MDVSGEVADLMVKESIQLTEASIKMLAAGSKDLTAFLWALARDGKKLSGKTNMGRLLREGKELRVFRIREADLEEFKGYARKNVLFSVLKDKRREDGMVDLVTNVDFISQVNLFMERRGYAAPARSQEDPPKKADPRAPQGSSSPQRGSGSTATRPRPTKMTADAPAGEEKPSVREKLADCQAEVKRRAAKSKQRTRPTKPKTR